MSPHSLPVWARRLVRLPTAFHLWCAERELRLAAAGPLASARHRNLDLLRRYRRRGEFPRNTGRRDRAVPCFVDGDGLQCAVAFLMSQAGAGQTVARLAAAANHARVRDMHDPGLAAWAGDSGLSEAELGRIQPMYPPDTAAADRYALIVLTVWFAGAFAVTSVLFNLGRLAWAHRPRSTTVALGFLVGLFLIGFTTLVHPGPAALTRLWTRVQAARDCGFTLGLVCVAAAWAACRGLPRRPADPGPPAVHSPHAPD